MKKLGMFLVMVLMASFAVAQNGNSANFHVAYAKASPGAGNMEILEIKITRPSVNEITGLSVDFNGSRAATLPMTKVTSDSGDSNGNSGNNANELWIVSVDLDAYADTNGDVFLEIRPSCCYIPQGGIVVRSKGR